MGEDSKIEWTKHTKNFWWGCEKVSEGCKNCYADELDARYHADDRHWGPGSSRLFFGEKSWREPYKWDRAAAAAGERHRVFCSSMADFFEDRADLVEVRERAWKVIRETTNLDWLLLTKRPENFSTMLPWSPYEPVDESGQLNYRARRSGWGDPWANVWLGASAENQPRADERLPILLGTPAFKRFVSYEPALELVDFGAFVPDGDPENRAWCLRNGGCEYGIERHETHPADACITCGTLRGDWDALLERDGSPKLSWLIAGSESGRRARPARLEWYANVRDQVVGAGVSYFLKQHAEDGKKISLPMIDGRRWEEVPS